MERFCRHCGATLEPTDEFCGSCGLAVDEDAAHRHEAPSSRSAWIIGGAVILAALLVVVAIWLLARGGDDTGDGAATPVPSGSSVASGEPTPSSFPAPTVAEARLEGTYRLELTGTKSTVEGVDGGSTTVVIMFKPRCSTGACDTTMQSRPSILLTRDEADYSGANDGAFGSTCNGSGIDSEWSFNLRARKAADGTITRLEGKARETIAAQSGCEDARASYAVTAIATSKSPTGTLPSVSLENFPPLSTPFDASKFLLDSWLDDDEPAAEWAADPQAVKFLWGIQRKDYTLTCSGLAYLGGKHCGLLLHKMKFPIIIFELRSNADPAWKVKTAYWNAD